MAPVLFNLYMYLAVERWLERVEGEDGVWNYCQVQDGREAFPEIH